MRMCVYVLCACLAWVFAYVCECVYACVCVRLCVYDCVCLSVVVFVCA